jgi:hypothetical protein
LNIELNKKYDFYVNLLNLPFDSSLGQYMRKATHPSDGVDSLDPRRWRVEQLHHHGGDVCCVFVLCVEVSLIGCKKVPEHNLKVCISPY